MKSASLLIALVFVCFHGVPSRTNTAGSRKYDKAVEEARKIGHPIFVDVYADWCQWCHKLDQEVYANPKFIQFMQKDFVP